MSLNLIRIIPCLEKEMRIRAAMAAKIVWEIENIDSLLSLSLKALLVNLFRFLSAMANNIITKLEECDQC
jgi:hypothetical protein